MYFDTTPDFSTVRRTKKCDSEEKPLSRDTAMDSYRFSTMNIQVLDSAEVDLDSLLYELCALENQLKQDNCLSQSNFFGSEDTLKKSDRKNMFGNGPNFNPNNPNGTHGHFLQYPNQASNCYLPKKLLIPPPVPKRENFQNLTDYRPIRIDGQIDPSSPNHNTADRDHPKNSHVIFCNAKYRHNFGKNSSGKHSPDNDSAFCDNLSVVSLESGSTLIGPTLESGSTLIGPTLESSSTLIGPNRRSENLACPTVEKSYANRESTGVSVDSSTRGSMATPSPTQCPDMTSPCTKNSSIDQISAIKAEKIRIALEKMKEASVRKIYVKIFTCEENSKSVLIDERMKILDVLKLMAEKNHVILTPNHAILEWNPGLRMERMYEDDENLVENVLMWSADSRNKLYFVKKSLKSDPTNLVNAAKEGILYLKQEGKKAWRKRYFYLRASGLYFSTKNKSKSSKDLICIAQLDSTQLYAGVEWKKKYKAPTDFCFALKHPKIQVKSSKYIKYLCAEDEQAYCQWIAALRISKNGSKLYESLEVSNLSWSFHAKNDEKNLPVKNSTSLENLAYSKDSVVVRPRHSYAVTNGNQAQAQISLKTCENPCDVKNSHSHTSNTAHSSNCTETKVQNSRRRVPSRSMSISRPLESMRVKPVNGGCENSQDSPVVFRKVTSNRSSAECDFTTIRLPNQPISKSLSFENHTQDLRCPSIRNAKDSCKSTMSTSLVKKRPCGGAAFLPLTEQTRQIHRAVTNKTSASCENGVGKISRESSSYTPDDDPPIGDVAEVDSDEELNSMPQGTTNLSNQPMPGNFYENCSTGVNMRYVTQTGHGENDSCSKNYSLNHESCDYTDFAMRLTSHSMPEDIQGTSFPAPPSPLPCSGLYVDQFEVSPPPMSALESMLNVSTCENSHSCLNAFDSFTCTCAPHTSKLTNPGICTCATSSAISEQTKNMQCTCHNSSNCVTGHGWTFMTSSPLSHTIDSPMKFMTSSLEKNGACEKLKKPPPPLPPRRSDSTRLTKSTTGSQMLLENLANGLKPVECEKL